MSSEAIREALSGYLAPAFATAQPAVPIFFENNDFVQPKGTHWVYVTIIDNDTKRANIGNSRQFKTCGVINCQIMAPEGQGSKNLKGISDTLTTLLIDRKIIVPGHGGLTLYGITRRNRGLISGWYSAVVMCEYRHWHEIS